MQIAWPCAARMRKMQAPSCCLLNTFYLTRFLLPIPSGPMQHRPRPETDPFLPNLQRCNSNRPSHSTSCRSVIQCTLLCV
ncbi:hypothetical protein FKM82_025532 [Ascaphus truei]